MKHKLVSVIIPTYNRAHSVVEAIRSVQNQSYPAVQIIVIDDGSQDTTAEAISQIEGLEYYYQENRGQGAARNLGLKYAKGEYIASLDSDDIWQPEFLTESVKRLEEHALDFVFLNWKYSDGKKSFLDFWKQNGEWRKFANVENNKGWIMIDADQLRRLFLYICPAPTSSFLMRRGSLKLWNEEVIAADDWLLILEMVISKPCRASFTFSPYWLKRVFNDNIYDGRAVLEVTENLIHDDQLIEKHLYSRLTFKEKRIFRKRVACTVFNYGQLKLRHEKMSKNVITNIARAFTLSPLGVSSYIFERLFVSLKYRVKTILPEKRHVDEQEF